MDYKERIIALLEKVKTEQTLNRVYKLLEYLYLREDKVDYKKEIIEMLEKIDNICWLRSIYVFMKTLLG